MRVPPPEVGTVWVFPLRVGAGTGPDGWPEGTGPPGDPARAGPPGAGAGPPPAGFAGAGAGAAAGAVVVVVLSGAAVVVVVARAAVVVVVWDRRPAAAAPGRSMTRAAAPQGTRAATQGEGLPCFVSLIPAGVPPRKGRGARSGPGEERFVALAAGAFKRLTSAFAPRAPVLEDRWKRARAMA